MLAGWYFTSKVNGCGGVNPEARDEANQWSFEAVEGVAAQPLKDEIKVNKTTGAVSLFGYPTWTTPIEDIKRETAERLKKGRCEEK